MEGVGGGVKGGVVNRGHVGHTYFGETDRHRVYISHDSNSVTDRHRDYTGHTSLAEKDKHSSSCPDSLSLLCSSVTLKTFDLLSAVLLC